MVQLEHTEGVMQLLLLDELAKPPEETVKKVLSIVGGQVRLATEAEVCFIAGISSGPASMLSCPRWTKLLSGSSPSRIVPSAGLYSVDWMDCRSFSANWYAFRLWLFIRHLTRIQGRCLSWHETYAVLDCMGHARSLQYVLGVLKRTSFGVVYPVLIMLTVNDLREAREGFPIPDPDDVIDYLFYTRMDLRQKNSKAWKRIRKGTYINSIGETATWVRPEMSVIQMWLAILGPEGTHEVKMAATLSCLHSLSLLVRTANCATKFGAKSSPD